MRGKEGGKDGKKEKRGKKSNRNFEKRHILAAFGVNSVPKDSHPIVIVLDLCHMFPIFSSVSPFHLPEFQTESPWDRNRSMSVSAQIAQWLEKGIL